MSHGRWDRVVGQADAVARLERALERGAAGRSFLFSGPRGVGRELAARVFATGMLCPDGGCQQCNTCRKVLEGPSPRHFDIVTVVPEGAQILVEQVRDLRNIAARTPHEGPVKILIIEQAETMNAAASNALLKVLEEPSRDTIFILITERPEDMLDTIRSRCERIDFAPLRPEIIRSILIDREGVDGATATWAARVGGDLATALRLVKDPEAKARRERHLELPSLIVRGGVPAIVDVTTELMKEAAARVAERKVVQDQEQDELAESFGDSRGAAGAMTRLKAKHKREERAEELIALDAALRDLSSFYRDCLAAASGAATESLINIEDEERVTRGANAVDPAWLSGAVQAIENRRRMLTRNVQPRLAIESLVAILQTPRPKR